MMQMNRRNVLRGLRTDDKRLRRALQRDNQSLLDLVYDDAKSLR